MSDDEEYAVVFGRKVPKVQHNHPEDGEFHEGCWICEIDNQCNSIFEGCICLKPRGHDGPHKCDQPHVDGFEGETWTDEDEKRWMDEEQRLGDTIDWHDPASFKVTVQKPGECDNPDCCTPEPGMFLSTVSKEGWSSFSRVTEVTWDGSRLEWTKFEGIDG